MLIRTINPFTELDQLERCFFNGQAPATVPFNTDVQETPDAYRIEADLPGFRKEDIHITVSDDTLKIEAERHTSAEKPDKDTRVLRAERLSGKFSKSYDVSGLDPNAFSVTFTDGVLTITLPKPEKKEPEVHTLTIEG